MPSQFACLLVGFVGVAIASADEPATPKVESKVVEGFVFQSGKTPVEGAKVIFGPTDNGLLFTEAATTDAQGHYQVDIGRADWAAGKFRGVVLARDFKFTEHVFEADKGQVKADFELSPEPWKETNIRVEDPAGKPVAGVEVTTFLSNLTFSTTKTDADGR